MRATRSKRSFVMSFPTGRPSTDGETKYTASMPSASTNSTAASTSAANASDPVQSW